MPPSFTLPQEANIVQVLNPATDAAGRTGAWVSVKNAHKAYFIFHVTQGNAATILVTLNQATSAAGAGTKVLTSGVRIWWAIDEATTDVLVRQTDAVNFTTDAGVKNKILVFEIDPGDLDLANGFCYLTLTTGASNAANITQCIAVLTPVRYHADPLPTAIV